MTLQGVAVIIADPDANTVLLLHRRLHWTGWEVVKGHCAAGETTEAAARRETREETGLSLRSLIPLTASITFVDHGRQRRLTCFLGIAKQGRVTTGPEHDDARWVAVPAAPALLTHANLGAPLQEAATLIEQLS